MPANPALPALTAQHFKRNFPTFKLEIKKKEEIRKEKKKQLYQKLPKR